MIFVFNSDNSGNYFCLLSENHLRYLRYYYNSFLKVEFFSFCLSDKTELPNLSPDTLYPMHIANTYILYRLVKGSVRCVTHPPASKIQLSGSRQISKKSMTFFSACWMNFVNHQKISFCLFFQNLMKI